MNNCKEIKIIIVDDHPIYVFGLKEMIRTESNIKVIGTFINGAEGIEKCRELNPDIILMDINIPLINGIEAAKQILLEDKRKKIIMISTYNDRRHIINSFRAGAMGYIIKDQSGEDVVKAINDVFNGKPYISSDTVHSSLLDEIKGLYPQRNKVKISLMENEITILKELAKGKDTKEIAEIIFKTEGTTRNYILEIVQKLNAKNRIDAVVIAIKNGLFNIDEV